MISINKAISVFDFGSQNQVIFINRCISLSSVIIVNDQGIPVIF
jgi:hypothetical protein